MADSVSANRLAWWREARFGMFIHWGIYAVPAGIWKGERIPSLGEWIMFNAKIPVPEYERIASEFNPVDFDADEWARIAKNAGMRYLVITAKHHDGFAMYHSRCDPFNIVDATPFGRDPMAELAEACARHGLKLGFYYSQSQDWHEPHAAHTMRREMELNTDGFREYLERKVKPQLRELLTQYGPIGLIWFDTPAFITEEQSLDLKQFVHGIQPACLVSGRIGNELGDYGSMGDNQIPAGYVRGDWETPATLNDTWGYKSYDDNWKPLSTLVLLLADLASKGVNYLLNVGPTAEGRIPQPSIDLLHGMGRWMRVNGQAIYGSQASPYPYEFEWGRITTKPGHIYLHFTDWPRSPFHLRGLRNDVVNATFLGDADAPVSFRQSYDSLTDQYDLTLRLPEDSPMELIPVLELDIEGALDVDTAPQAQASGSISLPASLAEIRNVDADHPIVIGRAGVTEGWCSPANGIEWQFKTAVPGVFTVKIVTAAPNRWQEWRGGHAVKVTVDNQELDVHITGEEESNSPRAGYLTEKVTRAGTVFLEAGSAHRLGLRAESLNTAQGVPGLCISAVDLIPET